MFSRASSLYGAFGSKTLFLILRHRTNAFFDVFGKRQQMRQIMNLVGRMRKNKC